MAQEHGKQSDKTLNHHKPERAGSKIILRVILRCILLSTL